MAQGFKTGGRQRGTPNKITRSFREAVHRAFENVGGVEALTEWAKENPGEFFKICARLIPVEISAPGGGVVTVVVDRGCAGQDRQVGSAGPLIEHRPPTLPTGEG